MWKKIIEKFKKTIYFKLIFSPKHLFLNFEIFLKVFWKYLIMDYPTINQILRGKIEFF